jgi:hypothetical protein
MIHYALRCSHDHEFDGWFKDSANFDRQVARGLLECPVCADTAVARALMAPRLGKRVAAPAEPAPPAPAPAATAVLPDTMPDQVRVALQRIRAEVEKHCDYVGPGFAAEARKIHAGTGKPRGIYGETTPDEAESLEVARIPWVPRADG